jgi:hypothetical protein
MRLLSSFNTVSYAPTNSNIISHICQPLGKYIVYRTDSSSLRILQSCASWYITLAHGRILDSRGPKADVYTFLLQTLRQMTVHVDQKVRWIWRGCHIARDGRVHIRYMSSYTEFLPHNSFLPFFLCDFEVTLSYVLFQPDVWDVYRIFTSFQFQ